MKKIFENAIWWSGVIMVGIILGITLQFVQAWTEPSDTPPGGNVGAPINTGPVAQLKNGVLGVLGLMVYNDFDNNGIDVTGRVLTAQDAYGAAAWAAGGGGGAVFTKCQMKFNSSPTFPTCPSGWHSIHTYPSFNASVHTRTGGGCSPVYALEGVRPVNINDDSWYYWNASDACGDNIGGTYACTICMQD